MSIRLSLDFDLMGLILFLFLFYFLKDSFLVNS